MKKLYRIIKDLKLGLVSDNLDGGFQKFSIVCENHVIIHKTKVIALEQDNKNKDLDSFTFLKVVSFKN